MRVLFTCQPSLGHWHPLVPLAKALEEAGHEVAFASTPGFCPTIEGKGFRCFLAGQDDTEEETRERRELQTKLSAAEQADITQAKVFAGVRAERALPDLLDIAREWKPDVLVRENTEYAGCVAAERAGIPHAAVQIVAPRTRIFDVIDAPFRSLCEGVGLAPEKPQDMLNRYLLLVPRPESLWNREVAKPPVMHTITHIGFNQSGAEEEPDWIKTLGRERPLLYVTMGTVFNHRTDIIMAILEGLREEPINVIFVVGRNRDPAEFGEQPEHIHIERYIPQSMLLPHCDMVLAHGGSGTMLDALSLGLPLVLIPIGADQPLNARLCAEAGAAKVVSEEGRTPEAIREAVREVLGDPKYREAAQRIQREIETLPGLDYAVGLLERLAAERKPILAGEG